MTKIIKQYLIKKLLIKTNSTTIEIDKKIDKLVKLENRKILKNEKKQINRQQEIDILTSKIENLINFL